VEASAILSITLSQGLSMNKTTTQRRSSFQISPREIQAACEALSITFGANAMTNRIRQAMRYSGCRWGI
jgi:hypothetical protein